MTIEDAADLTKNRSDTEGSSPRHKTLGTWAVVAVLSAFLVVACIIGYLGWTSTDTDVPTSGYVAMALGVIFSVVVGVGLMALVFYSSRKGYDEPVVFIQEPALHRDELKRPLKKTGHDPTSDGFLTRGRVASGRSYLDMIGFRRGLNAVRVESRSTRLGKDPCACTAEQFCLPVPLDGRSVDDRAGVLDRKAQCAVYVPRFFA